MRCAEQRRILKGLSMADYRARLMDSDSGGEGIYDFVHRDDLFDRPADEIVEAFFQHADRTVFSHHHASYELNGCVKHKDQGVVAAMGTLHLEGGGKELPFTLIVGPKEKV
jgi:hypothetical protein